MDKSKPQLLEESKVEFGLPKPTQSEMPIHVLFSKVESLLSNMEMAIPKELLVE